MLRANRSRYLFLARTEARQQWAYRGEIFARSFSMILYMFTFVALWNTAYRVSGQRELAGYTLAQIIWYLGMAETITLSTSFAHVEIAEAVRAGDVAYALTRPVPYPFFQLARSLGNSWPRFFVNLGMAVLVVLVATQQIASGPVGMAAFFLMAALALLLDAVISVTIGLLAFWLERTQPVYLIYQKLIFTLGGLFLPLEVFPDGLERFARWLPFQLIAYAPARAFVAFDAALTLRTLAAQLLYILLLTGVMWLIWRRAQRRLVVHGG
jgi:ABC-2 type transport system permease protein